MLAYLEIEDKVRSILGDITGLNVVEYMPVVEIQKKGKIPAVFVLALEEEYPFPIGYGDHTLTIDIWVIDKTREKVAGWLDKVCDLLDENKHFTIEKEGKTLTCEVINRRLTYNLDVFTDSVGGGVLTTIKYYEGGVK